MKLIIKGTRLNGNSNNGRGEPMAVSEAGTNSRFVTRWGLILSVLGIAVGTGNIWRFPRIAAQSGTEEGAGAFIVAWICFLFLFSIPLIIAEYGIGRHGRKGVIGSFVKTAGEKFAWMGSFIGFVATAIMFYYSVVAGWCLYYFVEMLFGALPSAPSEAEAIWDRFQGSGLPSLFHAIMILAGGLVIIGGVRAIERINLLLIPSLVVILLISLVRVLQMEGSVEGIRYLFTVDTAAFLEPRVWMEALTQNAWDTGAAWGLILTYGAYMKRSENIRLRAFQTGIGNNLVSLVAGVIILSTVFGTLHGQMSRPEILELMRTSGPASTGLTFIWMPQLFDQMAGGAILAVLFFLALTFAAFSSLIAMIELAARVFVDMGVERKRATAGVCLAGFLFGLPSAIDLGIFANQDFVWGVGLMVSGAFISFAVIRYGPDRFRRERLAEKDGRSGVGRWWSVVIGCAVPVQVASLLAWWIWLSAVEFAPDTWYDPLSTYSVATVLMQWGIAMGALLILNRKMLSRTFPQGLDQ